ncbi:aldehyde dehydrogenase [Hymenopellis radicata]|nr:aldehyde dehydrogenase [Hymenopellis radicata]
MEFWKSCPFVLYYQSPSAKSNLKSVTLKSGGKSPNIIFDDADLDQALKWAYAGQTCSAGSCILVQEGTYDEFINKFVAIAKAQAAKKGDPFEAMPQVSQTQLDRVVAYIDIAKKEGAEFHTGGVRL